MQAELVKYEEFVKKSGSYQPTLVKSATRGDLAALALYSNRLGKDLSNRAQSVLMTAEFQALSDKEKAKIVRELLGEGVLLTSNVSSAVSYTAMNSVLKKKGMVFNAVPADPVDERLKGVVAGSLEYYLVKKNPEAALNLLDSGFKQMINVGPRSTILKTSELVKKLTGEHLRGKRVVSGSRACEYCRAMAWLDGPIYTTSEKVHFHDNCSCYFTVI